VAVGRDSAVNRGIAWSAGNFSSSRETEKKAISACCTLSSANTNVSLFL
jgi:hypothetical protein